MHNVRRCSAKQCEAMVKPSLLMCRRHWFMVPADIRSRVWDHYQAGQEVRGGATDEYFAAVKDAVDAVAYKEAQKAAGVTPSKRPPARTRGLFPEDLR